MSDIFINRNDQQLGPFPKEEIVGLVEDGKFDWNDLAWTEGMERWRSLHEAYVFDLNDPATHAPAVEEEEEEPTGFFQALPRAFLYPFRGSSGLIILACGTMLFSIMSIVVFAALFGWIAYILLFGYFIAYLFAIVRETAIGEKDVTEFPGITAFWDDIIHPLLQFFFTALACLLPAIIASVILHDGPAELAWIPWALVFAGAFYFPMALLGTVIFNSVLTGLNPLFAIPSIMRIFLRYIVIVILLAVTFIGSDLLTEALYETLGFIIAIPVVGFLSFYFGMVQARILGLIYRTSSEQLGWLQH